MGPVSRSADGRNPVTRRPLTGVLEVMDHHRPIDAARVAPSSAQAYGTSMSAWPRAHAGLGVVGAAPSGRPADEGRLPLCPPPVSSEQRSTVRQLVDVAAIHASVFKLSRSRSLMSVLTSGRLHRDGSAIASVTGVIDRRRAPLLVAGLLVLMVTPAIALSLLVDSNLTALGALAWSGCVLVGVTFGFVGVVRGLLVARRWRHRSGAFCEVSNVANRDEGNGDASRVIARIVREADRRARRLVLRVEQGNERARSLDKRHGFIETGVRSASGEVVMERRAFDGRPAVPQRTRWLMLALWLSASGIVALATDAPPLAVVGVGLGLAALGTAAWIDARSLRLPNSLVVVAGVLGVVAIDAADGGVGSLLGAVVALSPLLLVHLVDPRAIGFGDVKYAAAAGLVVGAVAWPAAVGVPLVALVSVCVARLLTGVRRRAFGPHLFAATVASIAFATWLSFAGGSA